MVKDKEVKGLKKELADIVVKKTVTELKLFAIQNERTMCYSINKLFRTYGMFKFKVDNHTDFFKYNGIVKSNLFMERYVYLNFKACSLKKLVSLIDGSIFTREPFNDSILPSRTLRIKEKPYLNDIEIIESFQSERIQKTITLYFLLKYTFSFKDYESKLRRINITTLKDKDLQFLVGILCETYLDTFSSINSIKKSISKKQVSELEPIMFEFMTEFETILESFEKSKSAISKGLKEEISTDDRQNIENKINEIFELHNKKLAMYKDTKKETEKMIDV